MPDKPDYDVAIVGASIAGCTAATFLGRRGARVALLESHSDPYAFKRMCTHFIQASASPSIERLGLTEALRDAGGNSGDMNLWTRYGWISFAREHAESPMRDWPAWNIRREKLDPMMRELAAATDGVDLMLGHTVNAVTRDRGRVTGVRVREHDGSERAIRARLVVAADGRDSEMAKLAGVRSKLKPHKRFGYWGYYRDTPLVTGQSAQMWLMDPDAAYAFPTDDGLVCLTVMATTDNLPRFRPDPEKAMAEFFERLPDGPRIDPAKRVSKVLGKLELPNVVRQSTAPGLALIGDAAIAADPLWGVGCGWAFQSGEWLAESVAGSLASEEQLDAALDAYRRRHRAGLAAHERLTSAYSTGRRFTFGEKLLFRAAARDQAIASRMALMGERWITPQQMMTPAMLGRVIRVNLRRGSSPLGLRRAAAQVAG